jgi:hypothetical protein
MKDLLILGGLMATSYYLFGKKAPLKATENVPVNNLNRMYSGGGSMAVSGCYLCQRQKDKSTYFAVGGNCMQGDACFKYQTN